jgi:hypothetical protein
MQLLARAGSLAKALGLAVIRALLMERYWPSFGFPRFLSVGASLGLRSLPSVAHVLLSWACMSELQLVLCIVAPFAYIA